MYRTARQRRCSHDDGDERGGDQERVRRYVDHLLDLDVPVEAVRGRHGGYRLAAGYRMPPLMLGDDEALAVLLGQVAVTGPAREAAAPDAGVLLALADAVQNARPVRMRYVSADGRRSERTVHPYGLVAHAGRWYVSGLDVERGEERTFRVDRIADPRSLPGAFRPPTGYDPAERVLAGLARTPYRHEVSLRIRATVEQIRTRLPASVATIEEPPDGEWHRVVLRAERLDWLPGILALLDRPFVIERPDELRDLVRELAGRLARSAAASVGR